VTRIPHLAVAAGLLCAAAIRAQTPDVEAPLSVADKWNFFEKETFNPLTVAAGAFNGGVSQALNSDPRYGQDGVAYAQRFGASVADIATQNFFGDFLMASALHEDPRYIRRGPEQGFWERAGYAMSRAVIIRRDSGGDAFNWSNLTGTAMSVGFSNLYYPRGSRNTGSMAIHFATSFGGAGLANLPTEFWPDVRGWFKRHL
jgi:hypothetical protein